MGTDMKQDDVIVVDNVKKQFKVYLDKGQSFKERLLFRNRRRHEERQVLRGISFTVKRGDSQYSAKYTICNIHILIIGFIVLIIFCFNNCGCICLHNSLKCGFCNFFFRIIQNIQKYFIILLFLFFLISLFLLHKFRSIHVDAKTVT